MAEISYRRHRFPPVIIQHAVWLYLRFTLSYRDVEELLAEWGLDISYETVRCWVLKFGPVIARRLRRCRPRPSNRWHLDEMVVRIGGERMYLWRAVDHEGEVLDMLVLATKKPAGKRNRRYGSDRWKDQQIGPLDPARHHPEVRRQSVNKDDGKGSPQHNTGDDEPSFIAVPDRRHRTQHRPPP